VLRHCDDDRGKVVAYFFFDFNDVQKQDPELMLRSLICQLSQQCVKIPTSLDTLFSSCKDRQRQPSLDEFLEVMQQMIREFPQPHLILDALDECSQRAELMGILKIMAGWQLPNLHLLVTSRKERDIESSLKSFVNQQNTICLQSQLVDKDIQRYVLQRLSNDESLSKWQKDPAIRQEIEAALMKGAHGMYLHTLSCLKLSNADNNYRFRWAACQLDTLGECRSRRMLRQSLATLPATLDETYDRILYAIRKTDSEYAIRILRWLTYSSRPLLVEEIAEIVAIDVEHDPVFDREDVLEDSLESLNICSSLVTMTTTEELSRRVPNDGLDPAGHVIALSHYSVKKYLISQRSQQGRAAQYSMHGADCNEVIARSCLGYLLQLQRPESFSEESIEEFKLAQYSAEFWIRHAQESVEQTETLSRLVLNLFSTGSGAYLNWIRIYDPDSPYKRRQFGKVLGEVPAPLYYAARFALTKIVSLLLLESEVDVDAQGGEYGNALQAASAIGHEEIVKLLLDKGADVNAKGGKYGNALFAASTRGHEKAVKLLLDKGANIHAKDRFNSTALYAATFGCHEQIVKLLLDNGADVNAQSGELGYALLAASWKGHEQIMKLLLDKGANVNAVYGNYGTALRRASNAGHEQIVKLLLDKGANIYAQALEEHCNALLAASARDHEQIVKLLLNKIADVNAQGGKYGTTLQVASARGHEKLVKLLLNKGAHVNTQGGEYGNALQAALYGCHEQVVKLLLDKGANVNAQGGKYGNALQAASYGGHEQMVKLLLNKGANVNAQGGMYGNALQAASYRRHNQIATLLLDKGANVNAQGGKYGNALQAASYGGHEQMVMLLLDKGAHVNAQGGKYSTALQAASSRGHEQVVKLLLDKGTSINT